MEKGQILVSGMLKQLTAEATLLSLLISAFYSTGCRNQNRE